MEAEIMTQESEERTKPGYKKTKLGWIPKEWSIKRIEDFCSHFKSGFGITSNEITDIGGVPVYGGNGLRGYTENSTHNGNFVLIGRQGALCGNIQFVSGQLYISEHAIAMQVNWENHLLFWRYKLEFINLNRLSESSAQPGLSVAKLSRLRATVPPLPEQRAIACILSTWDRAIDSLQKLIAKKQERKKGLMQQLLSGKKRFKGFDGEWKEVRLGELGSTFPGLSGKTKSDFGSGSPYIPYMNIFSNPVIKELFDYVDLSDGKKQTEVKYGDIFFTVSSETPEEVGMSSVLLHKPDEPLYLNSFCFGFRLENFYTLLPQFAAHYLRGSDFRREMEKAAQGATRFNLSKGNVLKVKLHIPNINEQQKIASVLSAADREIEKLQRQLAKLQEQKKGLMQKLLTGEVRVK